MELTQRKRVKSGIGRVVSILLVAILVGALAYTLGGLVKTSFGLPVDDYKFENTLLTVLVFIVLVYSNIMAAIIGDFRIFIHMFTAIVGINLGKVAFWAVLLNLEEIASRVKIFFGLSPL